MKKDKIDTMKDWLGREGEHYTHGQTDGFFWQSSLGESDALSTFVGSFGKGTEAKNILTGKTLVVNMLKNVLMGKSFSVTIPSDETGHNYSDVKRRRIVLDGTMLKDGDEHKRDIVLGTALHEAMHLIYSQKWNEVVILPPKGCPQRIWKHLLNIVEDERIETKPQEICPGYVPFLAKCKAHFFGKAEVAKNKASCLADELMISLMYSIRYPDSLPKEYAEEHAEFINAIQNILTPYPTTMEQVDEACQKIFILIRALIVDADEEMGDGEGEAGEGEEGEADSDGEGEYEEVKAGTDPNKYAEECVSEKVDEMNKDSAKEGLKKMLDDMMEDLQDDDGGERWGNEWSELEQKNEDATEEGQKGREDFQNRFTKGFLEALLNSDSGSEERLPISTEVVAEIERLENSDWESVDLTREQSGLSGDHVVEWEQQDNDKEAYNEVVMRYASVINQLRNKMEFYGKESKIVYNGQRDGMIDQNALYSIPTGNEKFFKRTEIQTDEAVEMVVLCDESGSMSYPKSKIGACRVVAVALREAMKKNDKVNLWFFGHTADISCGDKYDTNMKIYETPSNKAKPYALGSVGKSRMCNNRDGVAINEVVKYVDNNCRTESGLRKLLVVISDGQPQARGYDGYDHTRKAVVKAEQKGYSVIQIAIGGSDYSANMFKHYLSFDVTTFANELVRYVEKVLHI